MVSLTLTSTTAGNVRTEIAPLSGLKMFARLLYTRDPESMLRIVIAGLYPDGYLDADDEDHPGHTNRERISRVGPIVCRDLESPVHSGSRDRSSYGASRLHGHSLSAGACLKPPQLCECGLNGCPEQH